MGIVSQSETWYFISHYLKSVCFMSLQSATTQCHHMNSGTESQKNDSCPGQLLSLPWAAVWSCLIVAGVTGVDV